MKKRPKVAAALISIIIVGLPFAGGSCRLLREGSKSPQVRKAGVRVFSSLGDSVDDFIRIHKRAPDHDELKYIGTAKNEFQALNLAYNLDGSKEGFLKYIDTTDEELIIVTGHNVGGIFHFTDGETLPLAEMARLIREKDKRHCFISCLARNHVGGPAAEVILTQLEAVNVIRDIDKLLEQRIRALEKLAQQPEPSLNTLDGLGDETTVFVSVSDSEELAIQAQITKSIQIARRKPKVKYIVTVGSTGGGMVIVKLIDGKD